MEEKLTDLLIDIKYSLIFISGLLVILGVLIILC